MIVLLALKFDSKVPRMAIKGLLVQVLLVQFLPGNNETIVIQVRNKLSRIVQVNYPAMPNNDRSIIYLKAIARRNCDGGIIMIL